MKGQHRGQERKYAFATAACHTAARPHGRTAARRTKNTLPEPVRPRADRLFVCCSAAHGTMAGPQGWQKHLCMHKSVFRSDSQALECHKAMLQPAPRPCPAMDPAMDPGMAAESARKGVKTRALCAKQCWLWGAVGQWTSAVGASAAVVSVCAAVHRSAALFCPAAGTTMPARTRQGVFLHCPCPCTARQRGRGGKAVNPLSDLAACKCRNRGSQTAPGQRPLRPPAVTASQRSADRAPGRPALQAG